MSIYEQRIRYEVINYLGSIENEVNDAGESTRGIKMSDIENTLYIELTGYIPDIKFEGKDKIIQLIRKYVDFYENNYLDGYIKIIHNEESSLSRTEAKNIARNILQYHIGTAYHKLYESNLYIDFGKVDKDLINEYLEKEATRMLDIIGKKYITY